MKRRLLACTITIGVLSACGGSETPRSQSAAPPAASSATDAVLRTAVPDLSQRLARFKVVQMPFDGAKLTDQERKMVDQLVAACGFLEQIYLRQSDPDGLAMFTSLASVDTPAAKDVRRYFTINGSRWDLVNENQPFVGGVVMPPGRALYPADLTREQVATYVAGHPGQKAAIYSPFTVVSRQGASLATRPYHEAFEPFVDEAANALRQAASLSSDAAFANFLRLRADALTTDDYYESDSAWVDLREPKFDVIFAPYETYLDDLLGVKTSYGASILIRNDEESRNLEIYQHAVPDIQNALPLAAPDRPSLGGKATPMEVMDAPFRAGDLRHGYQAVADNLPNDPRIHQEKGTKKIFFKNFMDARVDEVILPLAAKVMDEASAKRASASGYMATTVMHEIAHGLGPAFARQQGKQIDIREAIGNAYPGLEEAKADVTGMLGLKFLIDRGVLKRERLEEYYASYVAGIFRTVRFGVGEAHGRAEMMEFNYLLEQGALVQKDGRYQVVYARMPDVLARLAKELLEQEATGDRPRAEAWFTKYDAMPAALSNALKAAADVPIDVDPVFSFPDVIK